MKKVTEQQKSLIGEVRLGIIRQLFLDNPNIGLVLTGSNSLVIQDSVSREVDDLDFIIGDGFGTLKYKGIEFKLNEEKYIKSNNSYSDARAIELDGIKCEFYFDIANTIEVSLDNVLVQVQNIENIKKKKIDYIEYYSHKINMFSLKISKHLQDIKGIDSSIINGNK